MLSHCKDFKDSFASEMAFKSYVSNMRGNGIWDDNFEIVAASQKYQFNFMIFKSESIEIEYQHEHTLDFPTIFLEFFNNNHYNALYPNADEKVRLSEKNIQGVK